MVDMRILLNRLLRTSKAREREMDDLDATVERIKKMLSETFADLDNPFEHLLPPDRPPPGAPGARVREPSRESQEDDWFRPETRRNAS